MMCWSWIILMYMVNLHGAACQLLMCLVCESCPTLCYPMDSSPPGSPVHRESPGKNTGGGCHALLQGVFPTQGSNPKSPTLQADSLLSEPPGKPKNTGVGGLSLLQGIFLTQESNRDLLHCRQILYQLSACVRYISIKLEEKQTNIICNIKTWAIKLLSLTIQR